MLALVALVLSVGLVDSVNPSTIGPALYLATGANARRRVLGFTAGVFGVYVVGGIVLTLGPGQALLAALPHPGRRATNVIELCLGGATLILAVALWLGRTRVARRFVRDEGRVVRSPIVLGAGIMAVELPTAFPYFAVLAAVVGSGQGEATQVALVLLFNAVFVAPLLAIVAIRSLARDRAQRWLARLRVELDARAALLIPALVLVVAVALLAIGAVGLASD